MNRHRPGSWSTVSAGVQQWRVPDDGCRERKRWSVGVVILGGVAWVGKVWSFLKEFGGDDDDDDDDGDADADADVMKYNEMNT